MKYRRLVRNILLFGVVLTIAGCGGNDSNVNDNELTPQHSLDDFSEEVSDEDSKDVSAGLDQSVEVTPEITAEAAVKEKINYEKIYNRVLESYLKFIHDGGEGELEGSSGISEVILGLGAEETLSSIGYTIQDISGDGVPELLIGDFSEEDTGYGTMVYAVYNCVNGVAECTLEGWYRNAYHWMGDGCFTYSGSGGAIYSMIGTAKLSKDGTDLEWQDYYFTHEKDDNFDEIVVYHNTSGKDEVENSEEQELTLDDFWELEEQLLEKRQWLKMTSFAETTEAALPEEESAESSLEKIRRQIAENGDTCAVGYLGYFEGQFEELGVYFNYLGILKDCLFLAEIDEAHFIDQEGYELYIVVPATDESSLIVNEYLLNENEPVEAGPGSELGRYTDGKPVLLRGNISEVIPNLYFEAENPDGSFIGYNPSLSLRDGSLYTVNGIYDLTPYETLGIEKEAIEGEEFVGVWHVIEPDKFEHTMSLNIDGDCYYGIVDDEGSFVVMYSGFWEMAGGELNITMWEDYDSIDPAIFGTYLPEILSDGTLSLTHSSGDSLTTNMYYDGYEEFSPLF